MASSSSLIPQWKYDVFLSFRGFDTRNNFVSHLYSALCSKGIFTFKDDPGIKKGDSIPDELIQAIHTSRFSIVVISENYASSFWCLEELREIMEFRAVNGGTNYVIPIFYNVDPCNVRYQLGSFAKAFADMKRPGDEKVSKWKEALARVADLSGYASSKWEDEATLIKEAVRGISDKLFTEHFRDPVADKVGMRSHMEGLSSLLEMESEEEVRIIGISGMGGVGKTTIAECLYRQFSRQFTAHCFLDVKKICTKESLLCLQEYFLLKIFDIEHIKLANVGAGSHEIKTRLQYQKVFVVLDDVDQKEQLHCLANDTSWFRPGSRIIITTRDKGLLDACGVKAVYAVNCLDTEHALQMFKQIVFKGNPPPDGFEQLLRRASQLAYGLPSALIDYSSIFRRKKTKEEWEEAVREFEEVPHKTIVDTLRSSYTYLSSDEQIAFLHVACLFNGYHNLRVGTLLDNGASRIQKLEEKSLVDISAQGCINMHILVEQMGKKIVVEQSNNIPQDQIILWDPREVCNVLHRKNGTKSIEGLALDMCQMHGVLSFKGRHSFKQMPNVKFLKFYTHLGDRGSNLRFHKDEPSLPHMLKLLHWDAYPSTILPSKFSPCRLVELTMRYSKLQLLCKENKNLNLEKLMRLDVSRSKDLRELPDLSSAMQLKELVVEGCKKLKFLKKLPQMLKYLNAHGCNSLEHVSLPSNHYIDHLDLSECCQLNQNEELITQFLTGGQNEKASPRFACIRKNVVPIYFSNQSPGASIQFSPSLVDFDACIMVACTRPFHLQFSKYSDSFKSEVDGVFRFNLKPDLYLSLETEEEETIHHLVIIQGLNNYHAGDFLSTLQHPRRFDNPPVEIRACGVRMNLQDIPNQI